MRLSTGFSFGAVFVFFVSSSILVSAQTASTGALTGVVTDRTGAVISGATVTVTNSDTGQQRTSRTNVDGSYTLCLLPPGSYMAQFSAMGFKTAEVGTVKINVTETPVLDEALEVGTQREQVTVEGNVEAVMTASSSFGSVVSGSQVSGLPLTTRNYTQIVSLAAGVNAPVNNASAVGNGSLDFSVNGMDPGHNTYQMDGVSITTFGAGRPEQGFYAGIGIPSPDAISEFKIQTSLYDASYGRNPGANVNVVTKSGTNAWHGTAFEFFRNTDLNANSFFENRSGGGKPPLNQNQFGGVLGGPIKKDKLFVFGSYQGTRQKNGVDPTGNSTGVTLPPIPAGDRNAPGFERALGQAFCNDPTFSKEIGLGGVQVACDGSNINPIALNILRLKNPNGTYYIPGSTTGTYSTATFIDPDIYSEDQYLVNADYLVSRRKTIATRYFYSREHQSQGFNCLIMANACLPGAGQNDRFNNTAAVLKLTSLLTTTLINEARVSFQRNDSYLGTKQQFTDSGVGITPVTPQINLLAPVTVLGQFDTGGSTEPNFNLTNQFQWSDQISWSHGKHTIRAGGEFEHIQWPWVFSGISKGWLLFQTFPDFLLGLSACAPGAFPSSCNGANPGSTNGTPLSNIIATVLAVRTPPGGIVHGYRVNDASAFVQDDFKVTGRLTFNLGLRWEFDGYPTDKYGNLTNLWLRQIASVPVPGTSSATGTYAGFVVPANYKGALPNSILRNSSNGPTRTGAPWNNLAPRVGFAWQPMGNHKLVMRGGYGFFFDRVNGNSVIHAVEQSPPYSLTLDNSGPAGGNATLANPYPNQQLGWGDTRWVNFQTGATSNLNYPFMSENFVTPLVQSYDLGVQYQFLRKWVIEVGYVGAHGIHLVDSGRQVNLSQLASASDPINGIITNTVENGSLRVPFLGFAPNGLQQSGSDGDMKYNSLQITLRKQFSYGFQMLAAYTWARAFTNLQANASTNLDSNNPNDARQQYGPDTGYRPGRFVVNYTWDVPYKSQNGFTGKLLGGWSLTGVTTVQSGQPLTVFDSRGGSIYCGGCQAAFSNVQSRAQLAPGATYAEVPTHGGVEGRLGGISGGPGYINAAAFGSLPVIGDGTGFGDSGIGILRGPDQFNFDAAAIKTTRVGGLGEGATLQFRAEFFNIFNHPQFANPVSTDVSQPNFGWITATSVNPRLVQFALKYSF